MNSKGEGVKQGQRRGRGFIQMKKRRQQTCRRASEPHTASLSLAACIQSIDPKAEHGSTLPYRESLARIRGHRTAAWCRRLIIGASFHESLRGKHLSMLHRRRPSLLWRQTLEGEYFTCLQRNGENSSQRQKRYAARYKRDLPRVPGSRPEPSGEWCHWPRS